VRLAELPAVLMLIGLAAYAVLAGADFGAGFWQLLGGRSERDKALRTHAHHAMGPVWEANHVWLIFVLVVCWTAYPTAFGSIASTLSFPLFIAGVGIILRGTTYALSSGETSARQQRLIELSFAASSILTPFALGALIGGIASGRVPVGNAGGDLVGSWLNPTSIVLGCIAVATSAYLAAVYLAADAVRIAKPELEDAFRRRALAMAPVAGAAALAGLVVVRSDAPRIWDGLTGGAGLAAVILSALAGAATISFVLARRYGFARVTAATAVAAIIAGWGLAQRPRLLPGLTIEQGAADRPVIVATLVALALGSLILVPSLGLLYSLLLSGRFDDRPEPARAAEVAAAAARGSPRASLLLPAALGCLAIGVLATVPVSSNWGRIVGVPFLLAFVALGFAALATALTAEDAT
jgi:cytochrome d ubiquinol oxidase subunit II